MTDLTALIDDPTIIETDEDGISINRWTEYGHDRLYINGLKRDVYVDLTDSAVHGPKTDIDIDPDNSSLTITRTVGWDGNWTDKKTVISLSGDVSDETDADDKPDADDAPEAPPHAASPTQQVAEPTADHVEDAGYYQAAGQAQHVEAQRIVTDGGSDESAILLGYDDGDRVYVRVEDDGSRDYGFVPSSLFEDSGPINFEEETELESILDAPDRRAVLDAFVALNTDDLVTGLVDETEWTQREAQMVVYRGWFGLAPDDFNDEIGITPKTISNHTGAAEKRQIRARTTAEVSSFLSNQRTDSTLILDADIREELEARKHSRLESTESVLGRLLDQTVAMDSRQYDTFSDVFGLIEQWIREGEPPFDPSEMDEDTRDAWLDDLASLERIENQYAGREFSET